MARMDDIKRQAQMKAIVAAVALVGTILLFLWHWIPGILGLGATGFLTYRWVMFRAKWGLKF